MRQLRCVTPSLHQTGPMPDERCEDTWLLVSECGCPTHRGPALRPSGVEEVHPPSEYEGARPPRDAILVHRSGRAHWYGCQHLPEYEYLVPPTWGWIEDRGTWQRIGPHRQPVPASGGASVLAEVRCLDCD